MKQTPRLCPCDHVEFRILHSTAEPALNNIIHSSLITSGHHWLRWWYTREKKQRVFAWPPSGHCGLVVIGGLNSNNVITLIANHLHRWRVLTLVICNRENTKQTPRLWSGQIRLKRLKQESQASHWGPDETRFLHMSSARINSPGTFARWFNYWALYKRGNFWQFPVSYDIVDIELLDTDR